MHQPPPSSFLMQGHPVSIPQIPRIPQTPILQQAASTRRVKCTAPGCSKLFNRKEHLTRHLKSHDPQLQHGCPICGRRYARSDVLKRHVEHHSCYPSSRRTLVACASCHKRKLKCDDGVPCRSCIRNSTECIRVDQSWESSMSMRPDIGSGNGNGIGSNARNRDDQILTNSEISEMSTDLPGHGRQQSWFQPVQNTWPLPPFPLTGLNASFQSHSIADDLVQWVVDPSSRGRVEGAYSAAAQEDTSFILPATNGPRVDPLSSTSRHDVDQGERTASSLASQASPASSRSSQEDHVTDLQICLDKESPAVKRLIQVYFSEIHPYWPILHAPTFDTENASRILLGSMVLFASWLEGGLDHVKLAPLVFDAVHTHLLEFNPSFSRNIQPGSLSTLQALLICVVYTACCRTSEGMLARAVHFNSILISTCRHLGIFNGQHAYHHLEDYPFAFWLAQEQLHRLTFSVLRVDAYLSILADHPPSVRYQEICIPLPKSTQLWTAASEDERRSLQWNEPVGREKALFCFIMRDALDLNSRRHFPYHLTEADYHLGLCALQVGTWEAAHEAHGCESDELVSNLTLRDPVQLCRTHLDLWWTKMENDCQLRQNCFSASSSSADHIFSPLSLILWHVSALTVYAPLKLLQGQSCCFNCRSDTTTTTRNTKAHLRAWIASPHSRTAVWNAAQISRIVAQTSTSPTTTARLLLNPLACPGVLKSAIVTCSYAYYTRACPVCTSGPPIDWVDLFNAKDNDVKLIKWKEHGEDLATWGSDGIPVCQCKVMALATWFRTALARDKAADMEFVSFLAGLGKG